MHTEEKIKKIQYGIKNGVGLYGVDSSGSGCWSLTEYKTLGLHNRPRNFSLTIA
jgi:hypothetical protein